MVNLIGQANIMHKILNCRKCSAILDVKANFSQADLNHRIYLCKQCKSDTIKKYQKDTNYNKIKYLNNRKDFINYFGSKCNCCNNNVWQFLTLDHINNDGASDRKNKKHIRMSNFSIFSKNEDMSKFQSLCMNCNYSKGHNGFCSHSIKNKSLNCVSCNEILTDKNSNKIYREYNYSLCDLCMSDYSLSKKTIIDKSRKIRKKKDILTVKKNIIDAYGGSCKCCGESDFSFLTIDHVFGGGRRENRDINKFGIDFYRWLKKNNYPQNEYQLLCYNCNCSDGIYGQCYHKLCSTYNVNSISIDEYKGIILNKDLS